MFVVACSAYGLVIGGLGCGERRSGRRVRDTSTPRAEGLEGKARSHLPRMSQHHLAAFEAIEKTTTWLENLQTSLWYVQMSCVGFYEGKGMKTECGGFVVLSSVWT